MDKPWRTIKKLKIIGALKAKLQERPLIEEKTGYILVNRKCVLAKRRQKFRLVGRIDWVKYMMNDLVEALNTDTLEQYYANQLEKYPPDWKDKNLEKSLKQKYEVINEH